jgi:4-hydroxy-tetrahydrodipicolinate synthase
MLNLFTTTVPIAPMDVEGVIPPMATPISDGAIATDALRSFTTFLTDGGVHGLFPCGSTGEFSALTPTQRETVVETVCEESGDTPVLAGCGGTSVPMVEEHIERAASVGADAAVVVTPYYALSSQSGLERFFTTIADRSPLPVVIYEIPALTGQRLEPSTVGTLADHDSIVGLKDSTGDLRRLMEIFERTPEDFDVLQGATELSIATLDIGGDGMVAGPANVYPEETVALYEAHQAGEYARAVEIANQVTNEVVSACEPAPLAACIKYLLGRRGMDVGPPLLPIAPLEEADHARLDRCYERIENGPEVLA